MEGDWLRPEGEFLVLFGLSRTTGKTCVRNCVVFFI